MVIKFMFIDGRKSLMKFALAFAVLALSVSYVHAQDMQYKVQTRLPYAEDNNQGIRRELVHQFKKDALKTLMADPKTPQTKARLIQQYFDQMTEYETIDRFFTRFQFVGPCDTGSGSKCGKVRDQSLILEGMAFISMNAIDNFLQSNSAASNAETSDFAMIFIARKVASRKIFDAKTVDVKSKESTASNEVVAGVDETSTITGGTSNEMSVSKSGGSTELKADDYEFEIDLGLTEALQSAMQEALINAGFEPFPMEDVLYDYDMDGLEDMILNGEFGDDGSLNRRTLASIKKVAAEDEVTFLGIGRVDYRLGEANPVTGDMRVPAIVTVEVVKKNGRRMRTVASVAPTMIYGDYQSGGDETAGQIVAQNIAVKKAMDTIVSQLQAGGHF